MPATMPPKMMSEMPLPMPFSVISSPSQTRNIVPAAMEITAASVGSAFGPVRPVVGPPPPPRLLQEEQLAVALDDRHRHRHPVRVELDLVAARLTLARQGLQVREERRDDLHDDLSRDVGVDAQRRDAEPAQGAAAEDVQRVQERARARVALEGLAQEVRVDAGYGHVGNEAEDDQHGEDEGELRPHVRLRPRVEHRLKETQPQRPRLL